MKYQGSDFYELVNSDLHMQWLFLGLDTFNSAGEQLTAALYRADGKMITAPLAASYSISGATVSFGAIEFDYCRESTAKGIHFYSSQPASPSNYFGMLTPLDPFPNQYETPWFDFEFDDLIDIENGDTVGFDAGTFSFTVTMPNTTSKSNYGLNAMAKRLMGLRLPAEDRWLAYTDESGVELTVDGYERMEVSGDGYGVEPGVVLEEDCVVAGWVLHRHPTSNTPVLDGIFDRTVTVLAGDTIRPGNQFTAPTWQYSMKLVS